MEILINIGIKLFLSFIFSMGAHFTYTNILGDFIVDKNCAKYIFKEKMAFILCFISSFILLTIFNIL